jgi:hypothetical protein
MLCKIWGFHGGDEEYRLLGYKNPVRTSQETHYVSATESGQLMLCKICGFHGSDYEECRLLGYKNPVRTSQETYYFSVTESGQLMLCTIWGFHGGDYEEYRLLGMLRSVTLVRSDVSEECSLHRLLVTANVATSSLLLGTLLVEELLSSETSLFTRATRCNIPEDAILRP